MTIEVALTMLLITVGRIADVTLGTMRTIAVVRGRKHTAVMLGFAEVFIWIFVVAKVVEGLSENLLLGISFAAGFAIGNYVGVTVDEWLAFGDQAMLIVSRKGKQLARHLREDGWRLTEIEGQGRDGKTLLLLAIVTRKKAPGLQRQIELFDPECFYTVEDVREASSLAGRSRQRQGWTSFLVGK